MPPPRIHHIATSVCWRPTHPCALRLPPWRCQRRPHPHHPQAVQTRRRTGPPPRRPLRLGAAVDPHLPSIPAPVPEVWGEMRIIAFVTDAPPCAPSSPTSASRGTTPVRARPGSAAVGGGPCRVGRPAPAMGPVGPARTGVPIRTAHRLAAKHPYAPPSASRPRSCRLPPACPLAANLSSLPARKSYEKCAHQPVAAKNRRLTRTTEPPILRFA